jgi:hypothetical protein
MRDVEDYREISDELLTQVMQGLTGLSPFTHLEAFFSIQ